jgi:hypothetical protein
MRPRNKHSSTVDHRRVTSGIGTGPSEPVVATVTSVTLRAAGPAYGTPHPQPPHELVERAFATAITDEPDAPQDFGPREVRIFAQPLRDLRRVLRHRGRSATRLWCPSRPLLVRHLLEPSVTGLHRKSDTGIAFQKDQ